MNVGAPFGDAQMKIQLLFAMAKLDDNALIIYHAGDIVELDAAEAQTLIDQGQAIAIDEPKPAKKKVL